MRLQSDTCIHGRRLRTRGAKLNWVCSTCYRL